MSEKGLQHTTGRPIKVEADFEEIKSNKHNNRFRYFSKSKVEMDLATLLLPSTSKSSYQLKPDLHKLQKTQSKRHIYAKFQLICQTKTKPCQQ
ncbi:MAG: transposase [Paludibacteraceae bacterium]